MTELEDKLAASVKKPAPAGKKAKKAQSGARAPAAKPKRAAAAKSRQKRPASGSGVSELHPRRIWPD